jgi:NAD(P)-dependent dehydrogenase (short-subunit alcohol dehydrogenase family)
MQRIVVLLLIGAASTAQAFSPPSISSVRRPSSTLLRAVQQQPGVVITGSAGGVGFAYAGEFMDRGYNVVICDVKDCTPAARALKARHPNGNVYHTKCDVSNAADVEKLGAFAKKNLGTVGYWINNAGINGGRRDLRDVPVSQVEAVIKVNLLGILLCTKVAMSIMEQQNGVTGHIFNTVGSGVKGGGTPGYACYGATKRGLPQLTATLGTYTCTRGALSFLVMSTKACLLANHGISPHGSQGTRRGGTRIPKAYNSWNDPSAQSFAGHGVYAVAARRLDARIAQVSLWRTGRPARRSGGRSGT